MHSETSDPAAPDAAAEPLSRTALPLPLLRAGKVRDVYDLGDALLLVATDRVSAFDVVLPQPIPRKGEVLTLLSLWWFRQTRELVPNHLLSADPAEIIARYPALAGTRQVWARRATLVRKLQPFPVECVVRGYLSGSAWAEYRQTGTLAGEALPDGLAESGRLPSPIFSPATKAEQGHDENIGFARMKAIVGDAAAERLREASLRLYQFGSEAAREAGIIVADTKFEFGYDAGGTIFLIDEILTPDSSRFWPSESYRAGGPQPSLDKQPLRDYLESLCHAGRWNKQPPAPDLPDAVVRETAERYQTVFRRLTGVSVDRFAVAGADG